MLENLWLRLREIVWPNVVALLFIVLAIVLVLFTSLVPLALVLSISAVALAFLGLRL